MSEAEKNGPPQDLAPIEGLPNDDGDSGKESSSTPSDPPNDTESGAGESTGVMDRGAKAWRTVAGSWFILFATFGYLYSFGVYQDFYTRSYLSNNSPGKIAWIGSFQLMMPFLCGIVSGKLFDAGYFHLVEITGGTIFTFSLFMLSLAKPHKYYQVFLSQGVGMGIGLGLTFVPCVSIAVHHFKRRKALAMGIALSGGALGAVVFPILLNNLLQKHSFGDSVRASGYLVLGSLIIGNCLVRTAYENVQTKGPALEIKTFFVDPPYMWAVLGALLSALGFYFPLIYLQLYAIQHEIDPTLSFYSLAILNAVSAIGRVIGNHLADLYGPLNILVPVTVISAGSIFAVLGVHDKASLVGVSIVYGIFAGTFLSLSMASLGSLARRPSETGARTGLALALSSFGSLGAGPAQGALLMSDFNWKRPIAFSGVLMLASAVTFAMTRMLLSRERKTQKV